MAGIYNIGNVYNSNNKKVSSKISFDVGDKFSGKIVKVGEGNEVLIKLLDGWQFLAELDENITAMLDVLQKFEVEGFENGKLKLKLINKESEGEGLAQKDLTELVAKGSYSKNDKLLLESMLKFNIPLTKKNIKDIQGIIQFLDRINNNPEEIDKFIQNYLLGKGISEGSEKGEKIFNLLKNFLQEFKNLSKEDILLFLENNIEFNKENIEAYNNLFKGNSKLPELLSSFSDIINNEQDDSGVNKTLLSEDINNFEEEMLPKDIAPNKSQDGSIESKIANKTYHKNDVSNAKISMLSLLKSLSGQSEEIINTTLKDIIINKRLSFTSNEFERVLNEINKLDAKEFINNLIKTMNDFEEIGPRGLVDDFSNYVNKRNYEVSGFKSYLDFTKTELEFALSKELGSRIELMNDEFTKLKDAINLKYQSLLEENLIYTENKEAENSEIANIQNENYIETNENAINNKEIINNKNVSNDNINKENNINEALNKDILDKEIIKGNLTSKEQVEVSISKAGEENKSIIKEALSILKSEGQLTEKVIDIIKNNFNEIKLFNKFSEEYYYGQFPVTVKDNEYPCKIIVKDNRKKGKKIDSKNVKMIITIDTKNLGTIDSYVMVKDKNININLKCDEDSVKIINMSKIILERNIENMGFNVNINVSKKEEEVSLTTCRDFFNTGVSLRLDRKV